MKARLIGEHLEINPRVCFGRLIFRGTRMPVEMVLHHLARGGTIEEALANWPTATKEGIEEAVRLAAMALVDITEAKPWNRDQDPPRPWKRGPRSRKPAKARTR